MSFYYADGDQQRGPFAIGELRLQGVRPETLVWRDGMATWERADRVPELQGLFPVADVAAAAMPEPGATVDAAIPVGSPPASLQYQGGYPAYAGDLDNPPSSGAAVASLVLGILALPPSLAALCFWWASIPLGILAVIFGHIARTRARSRRAGGGGMALAGLICGYAAITLSTFWLMILLAARR